MSAISRLYKKHSLKIKFINNFEIFVIQNNVLPVSWLANLPVVQVYATQLSYIWIWNLK
jgi:hypothetical protein